MTNIIYTQLFKGHYLLQNKQFKKIALLCVKLCSKHLTNINSFNPHNNHMRSEP